MPKYKLKRNSYRKAQNRSNLTFESLNYGEENFVSENVSNNSGVCESDIELDLNVQDIISFSCSSPLSDLYREENEDNNTHVSNLINPKLNGDCLNTESFGQFIAKWATHFQIPQIALNPLLSSVNSHFNANLPSDSRTLLNTPRKLNIQIVEPGNYYHFGVSVAVTKLLNKSKISNSLRCINMCVNIDGLPISKSNGSQLYPILCNLHENVSVVEVIGLYHGFDKPKDANSFLTHFIDEIIELTNNGYCYNGRTYPFKLFGLICDVPAKSFISYTKGHTGYSSCTKCYAEGSFVNNRVCFCDTNNLRPRNDREFRQKIDEDHHNSGVSLVETIPNFDMIKDIPLDPMHLIYLGVTRKLLLLWVHGKPRQKLSFDKITQISEKLIAQKTNIPCEFVRKPRKLHELKRFKATELRQFLCYTGPLVLKSALSYDKYLNFLCLHVAIIILSHTQYLNELGEYAHNLLKYFIETFITLYGKEHASHNIHNLIHLHEDTKTYGILQNFSTFPFENYLQKFKRLIRKSDKPLAQIIKRKMEEDSCQNITETSSDGRIEILPKYDHRNGPILKNFESCDQFKQVDFKLFILKCSEGDNCCFFGDKSIVCIQNFVRKDQNLFVIGQKYNTVEDFYLKPCKSSLINIFLVSDLGPVTAWNIKDIKFKFVKMSYKNKFLVVPLLHTS